MRSIRVLIIDDHEIVREGLQTLLSEEPDFEVVGAVGDGLSAVTLAQTTKPDVIVMIWSCLASMGLKQPGASSITILKHACWC